MTVENCLKHLEAYKKQAENPMSPDGVPYTGEQRKNALSTSRFNVKMMEDHILKSAQKGGKFRGHPIVEEILKSREVISKVEKPKPSKKTKKAAQEA
jgi:hypothetical protein